MIIKKYPMPDSESAASRYDREWLNIPDLDTEGHADDRHDRTLLQQTVERKSRRYVDNNVSAVTNGAPVFDPNGVTPTNPGGNSGALWTDNFEGPELNSRWTVIQGQINLPPLKRVGAEPLQIVSRDPIMSSNMEISVNINPAATTYVSLGFRAGLEVQGPQSEVTILNEGSYANGWGTDYESESLTSSTVEKLTLKFIDGFVELFVNNISVRVLEPEFSPLTGPFYPWLKIEGDAGTEITSVSVKILSNGD